MPAPSQIIGISAFLKAVRQRLESSCSSAQPAEVVAQPSPENIRWCDMEGLLALSDEDLVTETYRRLFGRDPDQEGYAFYLGRVRSGMSALELINALADSDEARFRNVRVIGLRWAQYLDKPRNTATEGGQWLIDVADLTMLDGREFIEAAYRQILGRFPDPEGMEIWNTLLEGGNVSKAHLIEALSKTDEARASGVLIRGLGSNGDFADQLAVAHSALRRQVAFCMGTLAELEELVRELRCAVWQLGSPDRRHMGHESGTLQ